MDSEKRPNVVVVYAKPVETLSDLETGAAPPCIHISGVLFIGGNGGAWSHSCDLLQVT